MAAVDASARRVLLVDDNEDAVGLLEDVLQTFGYATRIAFDGPSALEIAGEQRPEVAVLDIGLPVMDGYELAQRLREQLPGIALIAVTGYGQDEDQRKAGAAGFSRHFVKPVQIGHLRAAIDELLPKA
jgi:CheY-like chemotaxis protein